jgi:acetolactate synthase regulatory subunit
MQRTEHQVSLLSRRAYDSLGRILDLMRKMEFELTELHLENANGLAEITISLRPLGRHSVDALLRSIEQIVGVGLIRPDALGLQDISKEHQWSTYGLAQG